MIICTILMVGCGKRVSQKGWYNYGNGCVNLSNVTNVQSEMSFSLSLAEKDEYGANKVVVLASGAITENNVNEIREGIVKYSGKWEGIEYSAYIRFDSFTLKLYTMDAAGLQCNDEGCIKLAELWLSDYQKLLRYMAPYTP